MTVVTPEILQYGRAEPYISLVELTSSPTASMLDFSNFILGANQAAQNAAMEQLIIRASSKVDVHCMGTLGTLNATGNTENGRYPISRDGLFVVTPYFRPVTAVSAFAWGPTPPPGNVLTVSTQTVWVERQQIFAQVFGGSGTQLFTGINGLGAVISSGWPPSGNYFCEWTYVNGWANSFTTAASLVHDTSVVVGDPTGIYPGMQLTIWDGINDEPVVVANTYVPGATTIPFTTQLVYAHGAGTNVSAVPAAVKQAVIHFVVSMVRERGEGGFTIQQEGTSYNPNTGGKTLNEHEMAAYDLLEEFVMPTGRM